MSALAAAAMFAFFSMSGFGGGDDQVDVPSTPDLWNATLTDSTLTDTTLTEFSWDGYTHVQGTLGAGTISIKFDDISKIDFEETESKNKVLALVNLKNGTIKKVGVDGRTALYGKTGFGNFKVLVKDAKKIVFTAGPVPRPSASPTPKSKP